jgi:hypothetical protein
MPRNDRGWPERSPDKVRAMRAKVPRGPHLLCYRCDSFEMSERGRCKHCDCYDMVAYCHKKVCGECLQARERRRARQRGAA